MIHLRLFAQRYRFAWLLCLVIAFIGVQGANLHLDVYDHHHHGEAQPASHVEHKSTALCGVSCDNSDSHDNITKLDITPEGLVKKFSSNSLTVALLAAILIIFVSRQTPIRLNRHQGVTPLPRWQTALYPPLRAPPR